MQKVEGQLRHDLGYGEGCRCFRSVAGAGLFEAEERAEIAEDHERQDQCVKGAKNAPRDRLRYRARSAYFWRVWRIEAGVFRAEDWAFRLLPHDHLRARIILRCQKLPK